MQCVGVRAINGGCALDVSGKNSVGDDVTVRYGLHQALVRRIRQSFLQFASEFGLRDLPLCEH